MTDLKLVVFHSQTDSAYNVLKSMVYNIGEDSVIEALVDSGLATSGIGLVYNIIMNETG